MFDNFVVDLPQNEASSVALEENSIVVTAHEEEISSDADIASFIAPSQPDTPEVAPVSEPEPKPDIEPISTPKQVEVTYSLSELQDAVNKAKEDAYAKALQDSSQSDTAKQNILLEDISNRLMTVFAAQEQKKADDEVMILNFAMELVSKILPTLEKTQAAAEVQNFLANNFANFAGQESLSFSFHPDTIKLVADNIGRLAEQHDFEGKIAVHKDDTLGVSDCRVEWRSGGVERSTSKILDKVQSLINNNIQERENGQ